MFSVMPWYSEAVLSGPSLVGVDGRRISCWGQWYFIVSVDGVPGDGISFSQRSASQSLGRIFAESWLVGGCGPPETTVRAASHCRDVTHRQAGVPLCSVLLIRGGGAVFPPWWSLFNVSWNLFSFSGLLYAFTWFLFPFACILSSFLGSSASSLRLPL